MSRVVKIRGSLIIENIELAEEAIRLSRCRNVYIRNRTFVFEGYDHYDGFNKNREIMGIENKYKELLAEYYRKLEEERKRIEQERIEAEIKRLEEIRRIEEEKKRIEEEKKQLREEKKKLIIENAKKQGYRVKQEIQKDNTIKLVLQKRVY